MKIWIKGTISLGILALVVIGCFTFWGLSNLNGESPTYYVMCQLSGGAWEAQSSSCQDFCLEDEGAEMRVCTLDYQKSCDCGPARCWNAAQQTCVDNPPMQGPIQNERPDLTL